jgi:hypothetical protein
MTIEEAIEAALFGAARDLTVFGSARKAWPNVTFSPPAGEPYLRVSLLPNSGQRFFIKGTDPQLYLGILQLTVVSPLNQGSSVATRLAGEVASEFPADRALYEDGVKVRIERAPDVGQAFPNDATWVVPVSIRYECFESTVSHSSYTPGLNFDDPQNSQYVVLLF